MSSSMFDKRAGDGTGVTVYVIDTVGVISVIYDFSDVK